MALHLIAIGSNLPTYIQQAITHYQTQIPPPYKLHIKVPACKPKIGTNKEQINTYECDRLIHAIPSPSHVIALDSRGILYDNQALAKRFNQWIQSYPHITFMLGGSHGLNEACLKRADEIWSLSPLTLPHALARLVTIEQIYRTITILEHHPYHK